MDPALDPILASRIDALAIGFVERCVAADLRGEAFQRLLAEVGEIGEREIVATAALSRRLVDRPRRAITGSLDDESPIARSLADLREAAEDLDPARLARELGGRSRKLLGVISLGDPAQDALERYTRARFQIERILGSLAFGRAGLQAEIAAIGQEQRALATEIETLNQYVELARVLDVRLEARLAALAETEPERAEAIRTDVLFAIRQRRRDLLIQLAVATQGDAALRVVQNNNQQVVRTIRMAMTTTAAALRTSVAVAQAMADQRRILAQLESVRPADRATRRTSAVPSGPTSSNAEPRSVAADVAGLRRAWETVFTTLDQFDSYSITAIDAMREAIEELAEEAEQSRAALEADRASTHQPELSSEAPSDTSALPPRRATGPS